MAENPQLGEYIFSMNSAESSLPPKQCTIRIVSPQQTSLKLHPSNRKRAAQAMLQTIPPFCPDSDGEIILEDEPRPVCECCSLSFATWAGFEFHMLKAHIGYRPFRCAGCPSYAFHTEAEGRHHLFSHHGSAADSFPLTKTTNFGKEQEALLCLMQAKTTEREDGIQFSEERIADALAMMNSRQVSKFKVQRAQLPYCIRNGKNREFVDECTEPESEIPYDNDNPIYAAEQHQFYQRRTVEFGYEDPEVMNVQLDEYEK